MTCPWSADGDPSLSSGQWPAWAVSFVAAKGPAHLWGSGACVLLVVAGGPVGWTKGSSPSLCRCPQGAQGVPHWRAYRAWAAHTLPGGGAAAEEQPVPTCLCWPCRDAPPPPQARPSEECVWCAQRPDPAAKSAPVINNGSPTILGKRSYEQHNGPTVSPGVSGSAGVAVGLGCPAPALRPRAPADRALSSPAFGRCQAT